MYENGTGERLRGLEVRMDRVEAGISNFVAFQKEARTFFDEYREREKWKEKKLEEDKKQQEDKDRHRSRIHFWLLGILSGMILALFAFLLTAVHDKYFGRNSAPSAITESTKPEVTTLPPTYGK